MRMSLRECRGCIHNLCWNASEYLAMRIINAIPAGYFIAFTRMIIKSARVTRGSSGLCCCVRVTSFER